MTLFISLAVQPAFANQPEFFIKSADTETEIKAPRRSDYGDDLFIRDEGKAYLIQTDELEYWYRKKIIHTADLDSDGLTEVIVEASDGGGHGKIKYFIISKRGENFYSVNESNDFMGEIAGASDFGERAIYFNYISPTGVEIRPKQTELTHFDVFPTALQLVLGYKADRINLGSNIFAVNDESHSELHRYIFGENFLIYSDFYRSLW